MEARQGVCKVDYRIRANHEALWNRNEEEAAQDQELHSKIGESLSLMKDMADKSNVSRSEPRYEEMLSFIEGHCQESYGTKKQERFRSCTTGGLLRTREQYKVEEDHGKMEQLVSTLQSEKRGEDRQGKEDYEFCGPQRSKRRMRQAGRVKRRIKRRPGKIRVKEKTRGKMKGRGEIKTRTRKGIGSKELYENSEGKRKKKSR